MAGLLFLSSVASCDAYSNPLMEPCYLGFSNWVCSGGQMVHNATGKPSYIFLAS